MALGTAHLDALPAIGVPLGLLMGLLSGLLALLFLRTLQIVRRQTRDVLELVAELLGIPTLWFSAPFTTTAISSVEPSQILTSYIITLAVVWSPIVFWPLFKLIVTTGIEIGSEE